MFLLVQWQAEESRVTPETRISRFILVAACLTGWQTWNCNFSATYKLALWVHAVNKHLFSIQLQHGQTILPIHSHRQRQSAEWWRRSRCSSGAPLKKSECECKPHLTWCTEICLAKASSVQWLQASERVSANHSRMEQITMGKVLSYVMGRARAVIQQPRWRMYPRCPLLMLNVNPGTVGCVNQ